ncbi:MAG: ankyrin repeat domain-containing protein [Myxococcales bacterium]
MLIALAIAAASPAGFLEAVRALDLERVERMLSADPSLASARDDKGSAVSSALGARRGEGFLPRRENRVLDAILRRRPQLSPWELCSLGTADEVRALIAKDPGFPQSRANSGWTPLHAAAFGDNAQVVAVLLDAGAAVDARARNRFDNTPLQVAMLSQAAGAANVLLGRGAEVNARQAEGVTALHEAAQNGDVVSIRMLLDAGADASAALPDGRTALDLARAAKHADAARLLQAALPQQG